MNLTKNLSLQKNGDKSTDGSAFVIKVGAMIDRIYNVMGLYNTIDPHSLDEVKPKLVKDITNYIELKYRDGISSINKTELIAQLMNGNVAYNAFITPSLITNYISYEKMIESIKPIKSHKRCIGLFNRTTTEIEIHTSGNIKSALYDADINYNNQNYTIFTTGISLQDYEETCLLEKISLLLITDKEVVLKVI